MKTLDDYLREADEEKMRDKIFLLSERQYHLYRSRIPFLPLEWWLSTGSSTKVENNIYVSERGDTYTDGDEYSAYVRAKLFVRPAIRIEKTVDISSFHTLKIKVLLLQSSRKVCLKKQA